MKVMIDPIDYERNRSKIEYCCSLMLCACQKILIIIMIRNARKVDPIFTSHKMGNLELATSKAMTRLDIPDEAMKRYCKRCHCTRRDIDTHMADVHELSLIIIILVMCFKFLTAFLKQSDSLFHLLPFLIYHLSNTVLFYAYILFSVYTYNRHL